jgi:DNA/RNA-binding domain of Phe-tRNA-synthetase-like protein
LERFPEFRVAVVMAGDLTIRPDADPALRSAVAAVEAEATALVSARALAEIDELQAWRAAYKAFGVKKTSYRSSAERLLKQVQQGRGLPRINSLVDSYNAVSVRHRMPIGADDLAKVTGPLAFRYTRPGDDFFALGAAQQVDDPPKPGEVVYADAEKILCRRWNWYQDGRSATGAATRDAILTVQCLGGAAHLESAAEELCAWLRDRCGARTAWAVAHGGAPRIEVAIP